MEGKSCISLQPNPLPGNWFSAPFRFGAQSAWKKKTLEKEIENQNEAPSEYYVGRLRWMYQRCAGANHSGR
jgi:hypothetical protein